MKPLTKERREEIQRMLDGQIHSDPTTGLSVIVAQGSWLEWRPAIYELLDAEQYWRTIVKSVWPPFECSEDGRWGDCQFCHFQRLGSVNDPEHKDDCPWLRAQE